MRRSSSTLRPAASCGCAEPTAGSSWPARSDTATSSERFRPDRVKGAGARIKDAVTSWAGVEAIPHRFGGTEYRYGRKEMGHVHGDRLADLPLPRKLHDEVIASGQAAPHHVLPETGWVSCRMTGPQD